MGRDCIVKDCTYYALKENLLCIKHWHKTCSDTKKIIQSKKNNFDMPFIMNIEYMLKRDIAKKKALSPLRKKRRPSKPYDPKNEDTLPMEEF